MGTQIKALNKALPVEELNELIIDSIQEIKGKNIVMMDLRKLDDAPTDYFIICEGTSTTQVKAISDNIVRRARDMFGTRPNHVEGERQAIWVCVDYFSTVVHVFHPETRHFYELEDLWGDATITEYSSL